MKLLFVCVGNSCRSQIAEAIARSLGHEAQSAGTEPADKVHKHALFALQYHNIDSSGLYPKHIDEITIDEETIVISMGCGVKCPDIEIHHDFNLEDPKFMKQSQFIELVTIIKDMILTVLKNKD